MTYQHVKISHFKKGGGWLLKIKLLEEKRDKGYLQVGRLALVFE